MKFIILFWIMNKIIEKYRRDSLKKITYNVISLFNNDKNMTEEQIKSMFNKKLLRVILSIEKNVCKNKTLDMK